MKGAATGKPAQKGLAAFTLTELLVLVAIGSLLTGLVLPDLAQTRGKLLEQACVANLKQWGMGIYLYAQDNGGWTFNNSNPFDSAARNPHNPIIPGGYMPYWAGATFSQDSSMHMAIRACPAVAPQPGFVAGSVSYSFTRANGNVTGGWGIIPGRYAVRLPGIPRPDEYALMMDSDSSLLTVTSSNFYIPATNVISRHQGVVNVLFADMHVGTANAAMLLAQKNAGLASPWFASTTPPAGSGVVIQYY
jgi:prepilin-type processing-associated H-X9-DG protein